MSAQLEYPHIETNEAEPARLRRLPRVRVAQIVMDYLAHGWSPEEMCRQHPYLTPAEAHAAMAYYYDHQQQVDDEIRSEVEQTTLGRAAAPRAPFAARLKLRAPG